MAKSSSRPPKPAGVPRSGTAAPPGVEAPKSRPAAAPSEPAEPAGANRAGTGSVVTRERIAARAYEIYRSGAPGTEADHWLRAERELKGS